MARVRPHRDRRLDRNKLFCVSGSVTTPGIYELPFGTTLRQVIDAAGGVAEGHALGAVLLGGAAGSFATVDDLDVPLTFEDLRANGLTLRAAAW